MTDIDYRAAKTMILDSGMSIYYKAVVAKVNSLKPIIPTYDFSGKSNIEEIKYKLAQDNLFNLIMQVLNP